jgi:hypothetical protein
MKKTAIAFLAFLTFTGFTAGVVGAECPEGQPCIMNKDGGNSSTATVEPIERSGNNWTAQLQLQMQRPSANTTERLVNASYDTVNGSKTVTFTGIMETNSPKYRPDFVVSSTEDGYTMDIEAVKRQNDSVTTEVITENRYTVEFSSEEAFQLEVNQNGVSETFEHPDFSDGSDDEDSEQEESSEDENGGLLSGFFNWLSGLF